MKTVIKSGAVLGAVLGASALLSGCATNYNVAEVSAMTDQGGAFASALHKRYVERAEFEVGEGDWASVGFFNSRAEMSAMGDAPVVQAPSERNLKADISAIGGAYGALTGALKTNAPQAAPDACARAQTWFEHWMEQSAEGHQPDHIATARAGFEKAMPDCRGDVMPAPMAGMPGSFIIHFDHNSAEITPVSKFILGIAASSGKGAHASRASLIGHTDSSGSSAYNTALSQKRAQAVAKALTAMGMPAAQSSKGEAQLEVDTGDGVREGLNRRVEIIFER